MADTKTIFTIFNNITVVHRIADEDMFGNITCKCGATFYGGDNLKAVLKAQREYDGHLSIEIAKALDHD